MQADTVTLILSGDVPLDTFASAIQRFSALVTGLSIDTGAPDLDWVLADLQVSSAVATVRGRGEPAKVLGVVRAYERVGTALEHREPIPYSPKVHAAAMALRAIVGGRVESLTLETSEREAIIRAERPDPKKQGAAAHPLPSPAERSRRTPSRNPAYGAVEGQVQTLSNRGGLRFTLYDLLYDKAVSCYLAEGHEEIMRGLWGKRAVVEGMVTRDPISGRPLAVRQVAKAQEIPEGQRSFRDARGAAPPLSGLSAELAIRRLRDDA